MHFNFYFKLEHRNKYQHIFSSFKWSKYVKEAASVLQSLSTCTCRIILGKSSDQGFAGEAACAVVIAEQTEGSAVKWFCTAYCNLTLKLCPALPRVIIDG